MIHLARHIEHLLLTNDCVIVPGLGGFVTHHNEATWHEDTSTFTPPSRTVGFNPLLKMNDGLLICAYMETFHADFADARRRVEQAVQQLIARLHEQGNALLTGVGELHYSLNGTISFSPATDTFESPEYYGLDTFCMHPTLQTTTTPKPYVELHIPHAFLRNSVAVVLAIAFFFMVSTPVERMPVEQSGQATLAPTALVDKVTKESLLTKPVVPTVKPENEISNRENVTPVRKKYHLIVGSLATQADGEKMVGDLQNDGHRAHLITVDGKFRACIASYATRTEALEQLAAYRDKAATSNAWVLVKSLELPAGL